MLDSMTAIRYTELGSKVSFAVAGVAGRVGRQENHHNDLGPYCQTFE